AAGQDDAGREDDQRLADRQRADHHHLLDDEREVLGLEEPVRLRGEEDAREHEREQRTELRDAVSRDLRDYAAAAPALRRGRCGLAAGLCPGARRLCLWLSHV